ncbi:MAG: hypothetical protein GF308_02965 [Candidatus Heimdallarchaeota archaeon]|nr:hypothetical protein [Candidatus Heimdallarchaeota archaeon]
MDFSKGKEYLKKAGTDVFVIKDGMKMVFQPGSAYKDIKKERLPTKFFLKGLNKEARFPKEFIKHYKVSHHIDMERLIRACSILLTNFTGPETDDYMKNHLDRLFSHFMVKSGILCEEDIRSALIAFGEVLKIPKKHKISQEDYLEAAQILGDYFKLWTYNEIDQFFGV